MSLYIRNITPYLLDNASFNIKFINTLGIIYKDISSGIEYGHFSHEYYNDSTHKFENKNQFFIFNHIEVDKKLENILREYKSLNKTNQVDDWNKINSYLCDIIIQSDSQADTIIRRFRWLTDIPFDVAKKGSSIPLALSEDRVCWTNIEWEFEPEWQPLEMVGNDITSVVDTNLFEELIIPNTNRSEPICHDLLHEAKRLSRSNNIRSAFIIGFTALEIGIKEYLQIKIPDATWLIQEAPSPDVFKICNKYLPTIDSNLVLDSYEKKLIESYMKSRNKLIHRGLFEENQGSVIKKLYMVEYMLYRFDYSNGIARAMLYAERAKEEMRVFGS